MSHAETKGSQPVDLAGCDVPYWFGTIPEGCDVAFWIAFLHADELGIAAPKLTFDRTPADA